MIEEVTAHVQRDSLEDAREICADGTYFLNNLRIFFIANLICQPHPTAAFYGCVQTDSYLQWDQMEELDVDLLHCTFSRLVTATTQIGCDTPNCTALAFCRECLGGRPE